MKVSYYSQIYSIIKKIMPIFVAKKIRALATAILTPLEFSLRSGHFKSSLYGRAVDKKNQPIPWLTFPTVDLLNVKDLSNSTILEFGGGQSTFFFQKRALRVMTFEADKGWMEFISKKQSKNLILEHIEEETPKFQLTEIRKKLAQHQFFEHQFDIIIIDDMCRRELLKFATEFISPDGIIIYDNSESYPICTKVNLELVESGYLRLDLYGYCPGVIKKHCTSLYFKQSCKFFSANQKIVDQSQV